MRPDPGRAELEATRRGRTAADRARLAAELTAAAFDVVWAALREREATAGRLPELERARFVLGRLYPEFAGRRLEVIVEHLAMRGAQGTWSGFRPPASFARDGGRP